MINMEQQSELEKLAKSIEAMLETGEYYYLSPYFDIETGQLNGTFTADQLRAIAEAMDKLNAKR